MSEFNRKHPELAAKLMTYIESGLNPDEIIAKFKSDDENKELDSTKEVFPGEIRLISQALAYRQANPTDVNELFELFLGSYADETSGSESFRKGPAIVLSILKNLLVDETYKWLVVEAPCGREIERDGVILGACCYSTSGISRRNGVVEGSLGSIRLFGVLPRYRGFCIGRRLLQKVEDVVFAAGCCRLMACVPSPRVTILSWVQRRHYTRLGSCRYPAESIGHELTHSIPVDLVQFVKTKPSILSENDTADDKSSKVYSLVPHSEHSIPCTTTISKEVQNFSDVTVQVRNIGSDEQPTPCGDDSEGPPLSQSDRQRMTLPPLWRHLNKPSVVPADQAMMINVEGSSIHKLSLNSDSKHPIGADNKQKASGGRRSLVDSGHLDYDSSEISDVD